MRNQALATSNAHKVMEGDMDLLHLIKEPLEETPPSSLPSHDTANLLKSTKPPMYHREDRECTKAAVNTFVHKWSSLHALRRNPNPVCVVETSLSLEGKAYNWWMSLKPHNKPKTWTQFQYVFRQELLSNNKPDKDGLG